MDIRDVFSYIFGIIGIVWYYVCVIYIGSRPLPPDVAPGNFRSFMSLSVTTIGVSLATFVGMLLGLQSVSTDIQEKADAVQEAQKTIEAEHPKTVEKVSGKTDELKKTAKKTVPNYMQWAAAALYVLSLLLALVFWWRTEPMTDPAISNLGKSLLGFIAGAFSILLNLPKP